PFEMKDLETGQAARLEGSLDCWPGEQAWSPQGSYLAWIGHSTANAVFTEMHVVSRSGHEVFSASGMRDVSLSFNGSETEFAWTSGEDLHVVSLPDFKRIRDARVGREFAFLGDR